MNNLSAAVLADRQRYFAPVPASVPRVVIPLFLACLGVSIFILVVVHNAALLVSVLVVEAFVLGLFVWNASAHRRRLAIRLFLEQFPETDLVKANEGQLVKVTGAGRCVYTSTLLYEYRGCQLKQACLNRQCFQWNLAYVERLTADFYITDAKSGIRALVKAGHDSRVIPLIHENILVNITAPNRDLSSTMKKWLQGRRLSCQDRPMRLEEGYIKEGTCLTVMGMLNRKNDVLVLVPLSQTISTNCLLQKFLLPVDIDGLLLKITHTSTSNISLL